MLDIENGVDCWCKIAQTLNGEILEGGRIKEYNKRIWKIIHGFTDQDWYDMLGTFGQFNEDHGEFVDMGEYKTWTQAVEQFETYCGQLRGDPPGFSCMDYKTRNPHKEEFSTKKKSWNMLMVMRQVYCKVCGLDIPNR